MKDFLSRVNWLPVLVLLTGVGALVLVGLGRVEQGAVVAGVCVGWAVLARSE